MDISKYLPAGVTVNSDAVKSVRDMIEAMKNNPLGGPVTEAHIKETIGWMARVDGNPADVSFRDYLSVGDVFVNHAVMKAAFGRMPETWDEFTRNAKKISLTLLHNRNGDISHAKKDLAEKLGVPAADIIIKDIDAVMVEDDLEAHVLFLRHDGQTYRYVAVDGERPVIVDDPTA